MIGDNQRKSGMGGEKRRREGMGVRVETALYLYNFWVPSILIVGNNGRLFE